MKIVFQSKTLNKDVITLENVKAVILTGIIDPETNKDVRTVYDIGFENGSHIDLDISKWDIVLIENGKGK